MAAGTAITLHAAGDPNGERNLAPSSKLPRGQGLAAKYPGDVGIAKHPNVIFADNFEQGNFKEKWDNVRNKDGEVLSLTPPSDETGETPNLGDQALKVTATLGKNTGGGLTQWFESADPLFIRFYTKFAPTCDYIHHFCTLRANKRLHGKERWSGFGGAGIQPEGNERFSTGR